jgi:hypothetical protein
MSFQHKPETGSLFKNDKRESDSHPNARGSALIDGVEYWVDAWTNDGTKGKWQALKFKRKEAAPEQRQAARSSAPDQDDDIPW